MSDYISENTLIQILKYLPVQSLVQFRCVCKRWKELIDSQEFMEEHLAVQKPCFIVGCHGEAEPEFVVVEPHTHPLVHTLRSPITGGGLYMFGTLHGVVCLYNWGRNVVLWNPTISKFSSIPLPLDYYPSGLDKAYISKCLGFWIEPSTKEFKIAIMLFDIHEEDDHAGADGILYSSINRDWSVIPPADVGKGWFPNVGRLPVIIGGVAHWGGCYEYTYERPKVILSFDFKQESLEFIELSNNLQHYSNIEPIKWQGELSALCWHENFLSCWETHCWEIYTRQEGSWIKMLSFDIFSPTSVYSWMRMVCEMDGRFWALLTTLPKDYRSVDGYFYNLGLFDTRVGCMALMNGVRYRNVSFDFVESLLFP